MDDARKFRVQLLHSSRVYGDVADRYRPVMDAGDDQAHAHRGNVMASMYAYALAAAVRVVQQAYGDIAAQGLVEMVDDILTNGDDGEWNADLG